MTIDLPRPDSAVISQNPYGLLGLGYDCDNYMLYASSVAGSTLEKERGRLYCIDSRTLKVVDFIDSLDAFGTGIGTINGEKRLYFGCARNCNIMSVNLLPDGHFGGKPRLEFSLEGLGPRGDDRARKIRFSLDGVLTINAIEFYFNLTAPTEKQESVYQLKWGNEKWVLLQG